MTREYKSGVNGMCHKCERPYYEGDLLRYDEDGASYHKSCKAAERNADWEIVPRGALTLFIARKTTETIKRYFLSVTGPNGTANWVCDSETPCEDDYNRVKTARVGHLVRAMIEDRVNQPPAKGQMPIFNGHTKSICYACGVPIIADEAYYCYPDTSGRYLHVTRCEPDQWRALKPARGGGTIFSPKNTAHLPVTQAAEKRGWVALLHKTRKTGERVRHYFENLNDAGYMVALGRVSEPNQILWMRDTVEDEKETRPNHSCPRCGYPYSNANMQTRLRTCNQCEYQYPMDQKNPVSEK